MTRTDKESCDGTRTALETSPATEKVEKCPTYNKQ